VTGHMDFVRGSTVISYCSPTLQSTVIIIFIVCLQVKVRLLFVCIAVAVADDGVV